MSYLFFWRAKAQRRKEIGEEFSDLPEVGRLFVNLFFGVQRKTLRVFASLRDNFFFFRTDEEPAVGRLCESLSHQSTQPQGAGGVSIGLVKSNRTENNVADPSLLKL